ncbi:MAG: methylthioribulose 1-phosphate dehydratase [Beijerinckiaceae bacterium]|nr:methylthioribulose 1-phosphate dehydratase [Beijerinckiaceae bacterium]
MSVFLAKLLDEGEGVDGAVASVIAAGRCASARNWVPATSGNFSVRSGRDQIAITRSGVDKGALSPSDILIQPLDQPLLPGSSAEASLHVRLYQDNPDIGAIFHVHSLYATVIARAHAGDGVVTLTGWELQKALIGLTSHETIVEVPVFDNDQDTAALAIRVAKRLATPAAPGHRRAPGYLLAGHGLYAWGSGPREAARHLEALEVLFQQTIVARTYQP